MKNLLTASTDIINQTGLSPTAQASGLPTTANIYLIVGNIINIVLGVLGIIFFTLLLISGWQWMTSGGNEQTIKAAKQRLVNAVIGLAIILAAYTITYFVLRQIVGATM